MSTPPDLLLTFYGDDFTGSTDALESLTLAGARAMLFIEPPTPAQLSRFPDLQALGVAGMTRSLEPEAMVAELRPAFSALRSLSAPHVHYKVCSTFDSSPAIGSIGRVIDMAADMFDAPFVPLLVGAPALGRHCVFGNLFARFGGDGAIHRLDRHPSMSRHPVTPADESDLRLHLARQTTKQIALFDILKFELPFPEAAAALKTILADGPQVVLFDVLYPKQLERIGALIDAYATRQRPLFSVGSSGVEMALGAYWQATGRLARHQNGHAVSSAQPLLVASGSCSPVTEKQITWALSHGFAEVPLDTCALAAGQPMEEIALRAADTALRHLKNGYSVIVHTSKGAADPRLATTTDALSHRGFAGTEAKALGARLLGSALGRVVRNSIERAGIRRVIVAGGDTSSYAARALGIEALEMIAPLTPGAPLCRAFAPGSPADGLELCFKGGQIGREDFFATAQSGS